MSILEEARPQVRLDAFKRKLQELPRRNVDIKEDLLKMFEQELKGRVQQELDNAGKDSLIDGLHGLQKRKTRTSFLSEGRRWNTATQEARNASSTPLLSKEKGKQRATEAEITAQASEVPPKTTNRLPRASTLFTDWSPALQDLVKGFVAHNPRGQEMLKSFEVENQGASGSGFPRQT